jgi:hypothetical protein
MFITNLTRAPLGLDGAIILKPLEENRFVEDTEDNVSRAKRLVAAGLANVLFEEGLVKDSNPVELPPKTEEPNTENIELPKEPEPVVEEAPVAEVTPAEAESEAQPEKKGRGGRGGGRR